MAAVNKRVGVLSLLERPRPSVGTYPYSTPHRHSTVDDRDDRVAWRGTLGYGQLLVIM